MFIVCDVYANTDIKIHLQVNLGVLMKNEQYNAQMVDICQFLHKYVPGHEDGEDQSTQTPQKILSGGDYLTFERHKSAQSSMANG